MRFALQSKQTRVAKVEFPLRFPSPRLNIPTIYQPTKMSERRPKRVVLHVREDDLEDENPHEAIRQYFDKINRPYQEIEDGRHYVHIHRANPNMPESTTYIIIDMEKDKFSGDMDMDFPHEMYNIVCIERLM